MMHPPFVFRLSCAKFAVKVFLDGKIKEFVYKDLWL